MGRYIVFEGIDGSGKSVISNQIAKELDAVHTREPTKRLADVIMANDHPYGDALLFAADRAMHMDDIQKWLSDGKTIVSDRSVYSNMAYQGAALSKQMDMDQAFTWIEDCNLPFLIEPEIVLLLDLPVEVSLDRVDKRGDMSRFEKKEYLETVRGAYLALADEYDFVVIDANKHLVDVVQACRDALEL